MLEVMRRYAYSWVTRVGAVVLGLLLTFWGIGTGLFAQVHPVASVNGQRILGDQVERGVNQLKQTLQQLYGANAANAMKGMNLRQVALENIIDKQLVEAEARHLGIFISDQALQDKIGSNPAFQHDGQFDFKDYEGWLGDHSLLAQEYEASVRDQMVSETVKGMIEAGVQVSDDEAWHAYNLRNEKLGLRYAEIAYTDFTAKVAPTDQQIAGYYKANLELFREPARVRIVFIHYDPSVLAAKYAPTDTEIQEYYKSNLRAQFTHPDQVHARHILLSVPEGATEAEKSKAKLKAQDVLKQANAGGDFAKLASKYSEDPSNKFNGGDLGLFGRGQMIKPFEDAAFAMKPGQITMVETRFGYHVLKLDEIKPAHTDTIEEAKPKIIDELRTKAGSKLGREAIQQDITDALAGKSIQELAKKRGLEAVETPALAEGDSVKGSEQDREVLQSAFKLEPGQVRAVPARGAPYLIKLVEKLPSRIPPLAEIQAKVRDALVRVTAENNAHAEAQKILAGIKSAGDFDKVAAEHKLAVKIVEPFPRSEHTIAGIGQFPEVTDAAAAIAPVPGVIQRVMEHGGNFYLFEVTSRAEPTAEEWQAAQKSFTQELVAQRRTQAWQSFVDQLTKQAKIQIDSEQLGSSEPSM